MKKQGQVTGAVPPRTPEQRRRFPRHNLDVRIQVSVFREGQSIVLWGRTSEIGVDGVGATLTGQVTPGEVVTIELSLPVHPHLVKVRGIVRYTQGLHCGFEFLAVNAEQRRSLYRVCEMLDRAL